MTEQQWLTSDDPAAMIEWFTRRGRYRSGNEPHVSNRKLRLFVAAAMRVVLPRSDLFRLVELLADGEAIPDDTWPTTSLDVHEGVRWVVSASHPSKSRHLAPLLREIVGNPFQPATMRFCLFGDVPPGTPTAEAEADGRLRPRWAEFRPAEWLQARSLALAAYEGRLSDGTLDAVRLAVLADALEEAGCESELPCQCRRDWDGLWSSLAGTDVGLYGGRHKVRKRCPDCAETGFVDNPIITHLRSAGPHVRGCWALDLILGKE